VPSLWNLENLSLFNSPVFGGIFFNIIRAQPHARVACIAFLASLAVVPTLVFFVYIYIILRKQLYFGLEWVARDKLVFGMKKHDHVSFQILNGDSYSLNFGIEPLINMFLIFFIFFFFFHFFILFFSCIYTQLLPRLPFSGFQSTRWELLIYP